jgi:hypothetical protein
MGKYLEALKILYGEDEKTQKPPEVEPAKPAKGGFGGFAGSRLEHFQENLSEPEPIPFTDHEIAEHKISDEVHRDDQSFVRQRLIGIYGAKRLELVDQYLRHFNEGSNSVEETHKKSNAGRFKANTWLREHSNKSKVDRSRS